MSLRISKIIIQFVNEELTSKPKEAYMVVAKKKVAKKAAKKVSKKKVVAKKKVAKKAAKKAAPAAELH